MPKGHFIREAGQGTLSPVVGGRDARNDLGYGRLEPKFHNQRQLGGEFPYYEQEDSTGEEPVEDTTSDSVKKKYADYEPSGLGDAAGSDPF